MCVCYGWQDIPTPSRFEPEVIETRVRNDTSRHNANAVDEGRSADDSLEDFASLPYNLAFLLCLFANQMHTTCRPWSQRRKTMKNKASDRIG